MYDIQIPKWWIRQRAKLQVGLARVGIRLTTMESDRIVRLWLSKQKNDIKTALTAVKHSRL